MKLEFTIEHKATKSRARVGVLKTAHSTIATPVFMPVATHAAIRGQNLESVSDIGFQMLLANTYHLHLRPGTEVFKKLGGIHQFMNWPGSVLTDSGGYQIFSLARFLKINEEGAQFRSYVDGKTIFLTPERSIETQKAINSDIMMVLDQCIPSTSDWQSSKQALELTYRWAKRCLAARGDSPQALFGIVQGACFPDLRRESVNQITELPFDGYALGGFAVGEEKERRDEMVAYTAAFLPESSPRYLMGVGTPADLLEAVASGMDMFDCILPHALAQQGVCFTENGKLDLRRGVYKSSQGPIDEQCQCSTCRRYSRAYLHHLTKVGEFMGGTLIGIHNLHFYFRFMQILRQKILEDSFEQYYQEAKQRVSLTDGKNPSIAPRKRRPKYPEERGDYDIYRRDGVVSIRQKSSGEIMHSVTAPDIEAEALYIGQSNFRNHILQKNSDTFVVWDVGLGAGTNAMATISAYEQMRKAGESLARLEIVSFERDLDSLRLTLAYPALFPHIRHAAPHALLQSGSWSSLNEDINWSLQEGDFLETMQDAPAPDLIFFDPFSYKTDSDLWTLECFSNIFSKTKLGGTALFTYSASTSVRAGLLAAGFFVAKGVATGPKSDTTIALSIAPEDFKKQGLSIRGERVHYELLSSDWLMRWERSDKRFPVNLSPDAQSMVIEKIRNHPQFCLST